MTHEIRRGYNGKIIHNGVVLFDKMDSDNYVLEARMLQSLRIRLRCGSLKSDDIVVLHIQDASGYFETCPEVLGGYFHQEEPVSWFLRFDKTMDFFCGD